MLGINKDDMMPVVNPPALIVNDSIFAYGGKK